MRFRPDIEGLRGLAVSAVVLFHLFGRQVPGGYIGVDIFFVLSGFLITDILYRDIAAGGRIRLLSFWARRVRRILPAATLVLLVTAAACVFARPRLAALPDAENIAAAGIFIVNWTLAWAGADYARTAHEVVTHYWSLAVEEQFYLAWPLLLAGLAALGPRFVGAGSLRIAVVILAAVSFALGVYLTTGNSPFAFYGTGSRAWQLLTGAFIALSLPEMTRPRIARSLSWVCLATLAASALMLSRDTPYPGWAALLPTFAAAGLIVTGSDARSDVARLLSLAPLRFVGRVSYSWYLWHWPVALFGGGFSPTPYWWRIVLLASSLALGTLSYVFIENPLRYDRRLVGSTFLSLVFGAALIGATLAAAALLGAYGDVRIVLRDGTAISVHDRSRIRYECMLPIADTKGPPCIYGAPAGASTVVLFGDSHAAQWFRALEIAARSAGWRLLVRTKATCQPGDAPSWLGPRPYTQCNTWREEVLNEIAALRPRMVVVGSGFPTRRRQGADQVFDRQAAAVEGEERTAARLLQASANVVFIADTPRFPDDPIKCLLEHPRDEKACSAPVSSVLPKQRFPLSPRIRERGVAVMDLTRDICPDGTCPVARKGGLVMRDEGHITEAAAAALSGRFVELLERAAPGRQNR